MKWSVLVDRLVREAGGALPVAKAMGRPTFQGTLHKIASGGVTSPSRASAERIAKHFKISIDALYDDNVAEAEYRRLYGGGPAQDSYTRDDAPAVPTVTEPPVSYEYNVASDPAAAKQALLVLTTIVEGLNPHLKDSGKLALAKWAEGKYSGEDAAETLSGLIAASREMAASTKSNTDTRSKRTRAG